MCALVIVLRVIPLLAFAGPMALSVTRRSGELETPARQSGSDRAPFVANLAAFGVYFPALLEFSSSCASSKALLLASSGALLGVLGAIVVLRSRTELGAAWSFVPKADRGAGFVTTGPYRLVRHPIYLGFVLLTMGEALAFGSWPALIVVLCGIVPTFVWRARAEETLLGRIFGEGYALYRRRTKMIIPYVL
jgi:protein-S-isoprenylcysteine O-methyltransferase Ste14